MSSESDSDGDFLPIVPPPPAAVATHTTDADVVKTVKRATKRERLEEVSEPCPPLRRSSSPPTATATDNANAASQGHVMEPPAEQSWHRYCQQLLPQAPLYERSFTHCTVLRDDTGTRDPSTAPVTLAFPVADIAVLEDDHGALVCTVDTSGMTRVWRKLPHGLFFLGELGRIHSRDADPPSNKVDAQRRYYIRADSLMGWLIFFDVTEQPTSAPDRVDVIVRAQRVNAVTLTVEARSEFTFAAPRVAKEGGGAGLTPSPFLVMHQYEPHVAFFVDLVGGDATAPSLVSPSGVVLLPCFPPVTAEERHLGGRCAPLYHPVPIAGTTNRIMQCVQQPLGRTTEGTSATVLVDAHGILSYALIVPTPSTSTSGPSMASGSGTAAVAPPLTFEVMRGLAQCPPRSTQAQRWRKWIQYPHVRSTDFCGLRRDAAAAQKQHAATGREALSSTRVAPVSAVITPSGRHVLVVALKFIDTPLARRPGTTHLRAEFLVYIFDFPTGKCVGRHTQAVGQCTVQHTASTSLLTSAMVDAVMRPAAVQCTVAESSAVAVRDDGAAVPGFYMWVPEVLSPNLSELVDMGLPSYSDERKSWPAVRGRRIHILEVAVRSAMQVDITCFSHVVGELEEEVRRGGLHDSEPNDFSSDAPEARGAPVRALCAPLAILRKAVAPSQGLKNLVTRSPVGSALAPEDVKKLFHVASRTTERLLQAGDASSNAVEGVGSNDTMLLTTSLRPSEASLLIYGTASSALVVDSLHQILRASPPQKITVVPEERCKEEAAETPAERWATAMAHLRVHRDFNCADFLPSAQSTSETARVAPTAPSAAVTDPLHVTEHATDTAVPADVSSATAAEDEEVVVRRLLTNAAPHLLTSPSPAIAAIHRHGVVFVKNFGAIEVALFPEIAPLATENFMRLSQRGYYNGLTFHRVIPGTIIQGGCPRGDGTGGESAFDGGRAFADEATELFPFFRHTAQHAWLAMANAGRNTNRSQIFFTVPGAAPMPWLDGQHTVFGCVLRGQAVIQRIAEVPRCDADDKPRQPVFVERVSTY